MIRERDARDDAEIRRGEAELRAWDRRRRLLLEGVLAVFAAGYAFLVLGADGPGPGTWLFLAGVALLRWASWVWGDRGARVDGARTDYSLRAHRLTGWAKPPWVRERAQQRLRLAWVRRVGWGLVAGVAAALTVVTVVSDPPAPRLTVLSGALLLAAGVQLWLTERGLAEARRWLADPPA